MLLVIFFGGVGRGEFKDDSVTAGHLTDVVYHTYSHHPTFVKDRDPNGWNLKTTPPWIHADWNLEIWDLPDSLKAVVRTYFESTMVQVVYHYDIMNNDLCNVHIHIHKIYRHRFDLTRAYMHIEILYIYTRITHDVYTQYVNTLILQWYLALFSGTHI